MITSAGNGVLAYPQDADQDPLTASLVRGPDPPAGWSDDKIIGTVLDVARDPVSSVTPGRGGRVVVEGTREGVDISVILEADGSVVSGFPTNVPMMRFSR